MKERGSKAFSGAELEKALKEESLVRTGLMLVGIVKPSEKKGHIGFSRSGCDAWVELPTDMIEHAEQLGQLQCKDHAHPVFRITLKEAKDPEARILASLLGQPYQETQPEFGPPGEMMGAHRTRAPFMHQAPHGSGQRPVRWLEPQGRRLANDEYGCCRWECAEWRRSPDGDICYWWVCTQYGCAPWDPRRNVSAYY